MIIDSFQGKYGFLSNFQPCDVKYNGVVYKNAEVAYQAQKDPSHIIDFIDLPAGGAKRLGRKAKLRPDWEDVKIKIMYEIVKAKFQQNPDLKEMLLETGDAILIEGNTWHDTCWGVCNGVGDNWLGRILMQVRKELMS